VELGYDLEKYFFTGFPIFLGGRLFIDIFIRFLGEVAQLSGRSSPAFQEK
jgi:hypothetical protein